MILKNYGEALQQQLQEQAELQLQLQQHLEQEIDPRFNSSVFKFAVIFRGNFSKSHGDFMKVMDVEQRLQRSFLDGMSYGIS